MLAFQEKIPAYVNAVLAALDAKGYRGYLVGGSLRDLLRGEMPHDYDMTTNATPEEMLEVFADFRVIPTGLRHGTLTVLSEGKPIEVTTHRRDGDYLDARHPENVFFTRELAEDLSRRDFTVNAMAWSAQTGLVDLFGGKEDLQAGVIRAVGAPEKRFSEDALRILRAFRFSAQLDFSIDPTTLSGAAACRAGLARISVERVLQELCKLLEAPFAARGLSALLQCACGEFVFGSLTPREEEVALLSRLPREAALRLALLLRHHEGEQARALCRRLHASNAFCDTVAGYIAVSKATLPRDAYEARHFACAHFHTLEGGLALRAATGEAVEEALSLCRAVVREGSVVELRRLAVNGRELQEQLGVAPKETGRLLLLLQDAVFRDPTANKKAVLLKRAEALLAADPSLKEV